MIIKWLGFGVAKLLIVMFGRASIWVDGGMGKQFADDEELCASE